MRQSIKMPNYAAHAYNHEWMETVYTRKYIHSIMYM